MSDDIDIEEHDVLDNPRIRNMFLDITSIKTEVEEYEEEDTSFDIEEHYHSYKNRVPIVFEEEINMKPFNNKIIIGSKPCMSTSKTQGAGTRSQETEVHDTSFQGIEVQGTSLQGTDLQGTSIQRKVLQGTSFEEGNIDRHTISKETVNSETSLLQETKFQNKIILGSKAQSLDNSEDSNSGDKELDLREVFVVLEDCNRFLERNPCFCEKCGTLFATDNDMDAHKMISHSFLVVVSKNKALKSTSKSYANSDCKSLLCNHCNTVFPNTLALLRHTYELLPGKFSCDKCDSIFDNDAACKAHRLEHHTDVSNETAPLGTFAICKICTCCFKWTAKLRTHMKKLHHTDDIGDVKYVKSNFQCHFCSSKLMNNKQYNKHIVGCHSKLYHETYADFDKISKFQCPKCNLCFSSDYSVRIHLAAKHGYLGNVEDSKKLANFHKNPVKSKKLACPLKLPVKSQKNEIQNITKTRPLPKSTLFKCNKCHIHFISCISAVLHSRSCVVTLKKGNYKCQQCRREFKIQDKFYHDYQHRIADRFKVVEVTRNILNRIICKCKSCEICFDEKSFMTFHTDSCNADTPSIQCKECNVWVHEKAMAVHIKVHASGLTFKDFIITEYVHASIAIKKQEKTDLINKYKSKTFKVIKAKRLADKKSYYYCPTCKCCLRINKYTDKHSIGQCNNKISITCKSCGLSFTQKSFQNHISIHKMYPKLKLKDLKFINIQTSNRIIPPFPNFKKCNKCKVTFFSAGALNNHACNSEESKICKYCKEKFSDLAYKLHIAFHEYAEKVDIHEGEETNDDISTINENIPELMKKYESLKQVWNILYLCQACDIVIDTYDKVVEHCQDHFCNMQSYNVTIEHCDICDLNFVEDCFKRHEKLHLNDDMDKNSFTILEYKYENLLSDSWMDMFKTLAKGQIQLILSKSMYKFTRCVRMKVVTKGSVELTLYQCAKCQVIVAPNKVMEHSQNVNNTCQNTKKFGCAYCTLRFAFRSHKIIHENLHEIRKLNSKSFRIIQFHADKQFSVTELKNETEAGKIKDPEGLKFIRCQHCGKLINKIKYKGHIQNHVYYNNYKNKAKNTKQNIQQQNTKPRNPNKILNFYVCRECKVCVAKDNIKVHICDFEGSKSKCVKCSLVFRSQNLASHYKSHEKNNFNRTNMQVMYFDGEVIDKKPAKRRARFETKRLDKKSVTIYQCSQCTLCIWVRCNISRHVCSPQTVRFTCKKCSLTFLTSRRKAHEKMHNVKSFSRKNVHLIKFNCKNPRKPKSTSPVSHKPKVSSSHEELKTRNNEKRKLLTTYEGTVVKKPRIDNMQSVGDFVVQPHNRYYKCKTCKLLFLSLTGLIEHEISCKTDRHAAKCDTCGLVFHTSMINDHKTFVNCKMFTKDRVYILTIKQIGKAYNTPDNWIYECINCDTCNISARGLQYHLNANHQIKNALKTCVQCNIKFTSYSYTFHLKIHHGKVENDISELSIAAVEDTTLEVALKDLPNDNHVIYDDYQEKQTGKTLTSPSINPCDICGLNFIRYSSLIKHKSRGRHKEHQFTCKVCKLRFTQISLKKHMEIHHKNHQIDNSDAETINTNINNSVVDSVSSIFNEKQSQSTLDSVDEETDVDVLSINLADSKNDEDMNPIVASKNSANNVANSSSPTKAAESVTGIYNCDVCNMNFLHPNSLRRHKQLDKHNEAQHKCEECGLIFSFVSVKKHIDIHHNIYKKKYPFSRRKRKIDTNDSIVESISKIFDDNQLNTSSIQDNITNTTSTNDTNNVAEAVNKNVHNKPSATKQNNIINKIKTNNAKASQSIENNHNETNENNAVITEVLNKNKLYKCSVCNVYFLTADDCREHTTNHIQLDTFEYIACKICDIQFCCEYLGRHMKSHREKTFSTDDLIVAEYHPNNNGEVNIDTYLFVKTKLVSTTTHDTVIVDSTTENLVESRSLSINDASESTPCIKADTGSETRLQFTELL